MSAEWYNENGQRAYPLAENASGMSVDGRALSNEWLVDLAVTVPRSLAGTLYLSSMLVTPAMAAIAIASTTGGGLLAGSWLLPESQGIVRALAPLTNDVSGYVVIGKFELPTEPVAMVFSGVAASGIAERAVNYVDVAAVRSIRPLYGDYRQALTGLIRLEAGPNVVISHTGNTIVVALTPEARPLLVGPCDKKAAGGTCQFPPLRRINGVGPDINGVIHIEVK